MELILKLIIYKKFLTKYFHAVRLSASSSKEDLHCRTNLVK